MGGQATPSPRLTCAPSGRIQPSVHRTPTGKGSGEKTGGIRGKCFHGNRCGRLRPGCSVCTAGTASPTAARAVATGRTANSRHGIDGLFQHLSTSFFLRRLVLKPGYSSSLFSRIVEVRFYLVVLLPPVFFASYQLLPPAARPGYARVRSISKRYGSR